MLYFIFATFSVSCSKICRVLDSNFGGNVQIRALNCGLSISDQISCVFISNAV